MTGAKAIDPAIVEKAALASYEGLQHPNWRAPHWEELSETEQAQFLNPARHALEAAAPLIAAKALREAADDWHAATTGTAPRMYLWLNARADALEAGQS